MKYNTLYPAVYIRFLITDKRTENPRVGGSNPPPGTIKAPVYWGFFVPTPHYNIAHIAHINHIVT